jgi:hypothetical protein
MSWWDMHGKANLLTSLRVESRRERDKREKERERGREIPFKGNPPMTYFLQLGPTS